MNLAEDCWNLVGLPDIVLEIEKIIKSVKQSASELLISLHIFHSKKYYFELKEYFFQPFLTSDSF
jgi:hypothetical protein